MVESHRASFEQQAIPVLVTMQFERATFSYAMFPIGSIHDLPVEPRLATTHEEQHTPNAAKLWSTLPCRIAKRDSLGPARLRLSGLGVVRSQWRFGIFKCYMIILSYKILSFDLIAHVLIK